MDLWWSSSTESYTVDNDVSFTPYKQLQYGQMASSNLCAIGPACLATRPWLSSKDQYFGDLQYTMC